MQLLSYFCFDISVPSSWLHDYEHFMRGMCGGLYNVFCSAHTACKCVRCGSDTPMILSALSRWLSLTAQLGWSAVCENVPSGASVKHGHGWNTNDHLFYATERGNSLLGLLNDSCDVDSGGAVCQSELVLCTFSTSVVLMVREMLLVTIPCKICRYLGEGYVPSTRLPVAPPPSCLATRHHM